LKKDRYIIDEKFRQRPIDLFKFAGATRQDLEHSIQDRISAYAKTLCIQN
jgi:uncharacterized Zn finger protein